MSKVVVVVQARTTSSRLPGKALLSLGGLPSVVLVAKRAANRGHEVVVATSNDRSDDALYRELMKHGLSCFRGSLENVQERMLGAVATCADSDWLVRLTGDNPFPDGDFVSELVAAAQREGHEYMETRSPTGGVPYGLAAEALRVGLLRGRLEVADEFEREHVTTSLRERSRASPFVPSHQLDHGALRCTMDDLEDYLRLHRIFSEVKDPVGASWAELCGRLATHAAAETAAINAEPIFTKPKLTIGTAQLGIDGYGRANDSGRPDDRMARELVDRATEVTGVAFDTARAYGDAEYRLGRLLRNRRQPVEICTKLSPLDELAEDSPGPVAAAAARASVSESCDALGAERLHTLLLHRWSHRTSHDGAIWTQLVQLQERGLIGRLGASVRDPAELLAALGDPTVEKIQLPLNLLDARWFDEEIQQQVFARRESLAMEIEVRSVYLQGILLGPAEIWPQGPGVDAPGVLAEVDRLVALFGRDSRADLCLAYVRSIPWVDRVVIGIEEAWQLEASVQLFSTPCLSRSEVSQVRDVPWGVAAWLFDPSKWGG